MWKAVFLGGNSQFWRWLLLFLTRVLNAVCPENHLEQQQFFQGRGWWGWFRMIQMQYVLHFYENLNAATDLTGSRAQMVIQAIGSDHRYRWSFSLSPASHLLLCGPVPNQPCIVAVHGPGVGPPGGGAWKAAVHGVPEGQTQLSDFTFMHWRRKWHPTPVFLPGESQGQRSLLGCRLWGRTESDTTEVLAVYLT